MKIVKLVAENIKGLKAIEIVPDGNLQVISGANGQGKSSVMDSIWLALGGSDATKGSNTTRPIRDGETEAIAQVDLGEIIVTRKWSANNKSTLKVESKDGAQFKSPQTMLNNLIGSLSFDPLSFSTLDDKKQMETLMSLVQLPKDPLEIDAEKKKLFDERANVNRDAKSLKSQLEAAIKVGDGVPDEEIKSSAIIEEMQIAQNLIIKNNEKRKEMSEFENDYRYSKNQIEDEEASIERMRAELKQKIENNELKKNALEPLKEKGMKLREEINTLADPNLQVFNDKLSKVDETNQMVREKKRYEFIKLAFENKSKESTVMTDSMQRLEDEKQHMIKNAVFPIEGLSFGDGGLIYNNVPFKQCSSAEQLKVSMAMAMALNPKLKVIRIMDGSLLDSKNMDLIHEMAKGKDYQVWIEVVDESGKTGIVIEEGLIKGKE